MTECKYQTIGEAMVRTDLNPNDNVLVSQIKQKSAELINLVSSIPDGSDYPKGAGRLKSIAMTSFEEAAMWGVKAATCK